MSESLRVIWCGPSAEFDARYCYDGAFAAYPTEAIAEALILDGLPAGQAWDVADAAKRGNRIVIVGDDGSTDHFATE
jgi:hypothetical protein